MSAALASEWLKHRRSAAPWLVVGAALFTPAISAVIRSLRPDGVAALYARDDFWAVLWKSGWESMAVFFLPIAAMLAVSLVTQVEHRSRAWKQVHVTPLSPLAIYLAKLGVPVAMLYAMVVVSQLAMYAGALVPPALHSGIPLPRHAPPTFDHLRDALRYATDALPIVAIQYAVALRTASVVVPLGLGFLAWITALAAIGWSGRGLIPYGYVTFDFLDRPVASMPTPLVAVGVAVVATAIGYLSFRTATRKG